MGVVYKAEDTKLSRIVALKFLPQHAIVNEDEKNRFTREAQAAAALNHTNIATVYEIDETDGQTFISMEFVEGKNLKELIDEKPLKLIEAIDYAIQIAEGLYAAHEKGVVHRDMKSANVMITENGEVKIMDFGLAKLKGASQLTQMGTTLGTIAYMSPEQAGGEKVDNRTDIWALGVIIHEMITGQMPFAGEFDQAIVYSILNLPPEPLSSLRSNVPLELESVLNKLLEKERNIRYQHANEIAVDLKRIKPMLSGFSRIISSSSLKIRAVKEEKKTKSQKLNFSYILSALVIIFLSLFSWQYFNKPEEMELTPVHFSFNIPAESNPILNWDKIMDVSPDGKSIAYVDNSSNTKGIFIRNINNTEPYFIRGTENGADPFFSKDNLWLTFTVYNYAHKVQLIGGIPKKTEYKYSQSASWASNGKIVSAFNWGSGLFIQKGWNSKPEILTTLDIIKNEGTHLHPYVLPEDKAAVFTIWSREATYDDSKIDLVNLETKERKTLNFNGHEIRGTSPGFIRTEWGDYLILSRKGNLYASLFDLSGLKILGPMIKILEGLAVNASSGRAAYSITDANNGTLVYIPGKLESANKILVWKTLDGKEKNILKKPSPFAHPTISNNGKLFLTLLGTTYKIGQVNFKKGTIEPFFMQGDNDRAMITPDGSSIIFVSNFETGKYNIYLRRIDGVGGSKKIVVLENGSIPWISNLSPDKSKILFSSSIQAVFGNDILIADINSGDPPKPLFRTKFNEIEPKYSPNGKLFLYRSDEIEGKFNVFVRELPINTNKVQVSINDGIYPIWSKDGTKIYYREGASIFEAGIQYKPKLKVLYRKEILKTDKFTIEDDESDFTVAADGRIILIKNAVDMSKPTEVKVIVNWFNELKDKLKN